MTRFSRTWWGERFLTALEEFTDPERLARGRAYANSGRVLEYALEDGAVTAKVRGSVNPYFGVTKEPVYRTTIAVTPLAPADWSRALAVITARADLVTQLMMNELPDTIEDAFAGSGVHLLPRSARDVTTGCSCPDYANPCKHVAALYYLLASTLDRDPFVLFEMRGLSREALHAELARSPLGQVLASALTTETASVRPDDARFTRPTQASLPDTTVNYREFWGGAMRLPPPPPMASPPAVPALPVKKAGDYPAFWRRDGSFLAAMEALYERVRTKSPQMKP